MVQPTRISPQEVKEKLKSGKVFFVCAYEDEGKCKQLLLEGAITFTEFASKLPSLAKSQEIVFYCA